MEKSHAGPLTWSVETPTGDVSAERPIIVGGLVAIGIALVLSAIGYVLLGVFGSRSAVARSTALAITACSLVVPFLMTRTGFRRRRRTALIAVGTAAAFFSLISLLLLGNTHPTFTQLVAAFDGMRLPGGLVQIAESRTGARTCSPDCAAIERRYRAPAPLDHPVRQVVEALLAQGWEAPVPNIPANLQAAAAKEHMYADVSDTESPLEVVILLTSRSVYSAS